MRKPSTLLLVGVMLAGSALAALAQTSTPNPNPSSAPPASSGASNGTQPPMAPGMSMTSPSMAKPAHASAKSSARIEQVQQALNENGAKVQVDGVMGGKTRAALRQFQRKHNLKVTGRLDSATRKALKPAG